MSKGPYITKEQINKVKELSTNHDRHQIAKIVNISLNSVSRICNKNNTPYLGSIKRFTAKEDDLLKKYIIYSSTNIIDAVEKVAKITGRSTKVLQQRWYQVLSKEDKTCVQVGSEMGYKHNRKNIKRKDGIMPDQNLTNWDKAYNNFIFSWNSSFTLNV